MTSGNHAIHVKTRVILADDHKIVLDGLRALLEKQPCVEIVDEVQDGLSALESTRKNHPDIVVMDSSMPEMNGIEATRRICSEIENVKVLSLSMHSENRFVLAALEAGASGYLLKDCASEELLLALRTIKSGQVYLSPAITRTALDGYKSIDTQRPTVFSILTEREREVLQLLAEGFATKEIAERLDLSLKTIGTHREHLMEKLEIHTIAGLTKYAIREGLTSA
ncbi:MAG: response regulator transcription factor [Gammaproteobacteria bacterium]|nr:response regulator transcription factor [Gammaproteobacteria bacterium]